MIEALTFVLSHEHRRSKWLSAELDLSFISDRWQRLVIEPHQGTQRLVRQPLEICIFTYLAAELKSGDACVMGSENFADFRNQLLDWQTCQSQLEAYCEQLGIASEAEPFVEHLQGWLTQVAQTVDQLCKGGTQLTISETGEPVLKRLPATDPPRGRTST